MKVDLRPWLHARLGKCIEKHGAEYAIPCPECDVHRVKEFRLWFNVEKNAGTCYKCHRGFDAVALVQFLEGVGLGEAFRLLKENTVGGVLSLTKLQQRVQEAFSETGERELEPLPEAQLPDEFLSCSDYDVDEWPSYVMARVGSIKTVRNYGIGWCERGYFRQRLIIPITMNGVTVSFIARDMTGKAERKVLYPKGCHTGRMLFNYDRARNFSQVVLVEAALDALRVGPRAMALFGTSLSDEQASLLSKAGVREVVVMLDGDEAGDVGTEKIVSRLRSSYRVRVVQLGRGRDPDDYSRDVLCTKIACAPYVGKGDLAGYVRSVLKR